jgi:uncharacterized protein (UPF0335 family)
MEWKNITANFSDVNGLMDTAANQMYKGSQQAVNSITSVADMLRQEKIDKLNELALKHKQYIEDQTLALEQAKQNDYHTKVEADIQHLHNQDDNDTKETNAHIDLYKNQSKAVITNANAALLNAKSNEQRTTIAKQRLAWQQYQAAQAKKDDTKAKEEEKNKKYNDSLKTPGSVYFTFDENGNRVNHPGYVYGPDGKPMKESVYKTLLNLDNSKKANKIKKEIVNIVSQDLNINPKNLDAAVNANKSKLFGNKPVINSRTYNDTVSTLAINLNGDPAKVKSVLSNVMVFDPKTGGITIPKQFVDNNGNFKSSLARKAFLMKAYFAAGMPYSDAVKKAGIRKTELNRLAKFDIRGQNNE